jgi:hypothetical protein
MTFVYDHQIILIHWWGIRWIVGKKHSSDEALDCANVNPRFGVRPNVRERL